MVFQVTQCPHCESTFNTDPRILHMAAGKVRCGACLTVFLAEENLVSVGADDGGETEQESVFIGHDPADFFDPSRFLTRGSLSAETIEPFGPANDSPEPTEPSAFEEEPSAIEEEPSAFEEEPATVETEPYSASNEPADWGTEAEPSPPDPSSVEAAPVTTTKELPDPATGIEATGPEDDDEHLEFFAAVDDSLDQLDDSDDIAELEKIAALDPADHRQAQLIESFDQSEPEPDPESLAVSHPEDISLSVSFSVEFGQEAKSGLVSAAEPEVKPQVAAETTDILRPEQSEDDTLEALVRQAIEEQDFVAAIEAGMQDPPAAPNEVTGRDVEAAATPAADEWIVPDQNIDVETPDEPVPQPPEPGPVATEVTPALEPSAPDGEFTETEESEVDTSTEAIRARALKQELKDEEALDAIPKAHLSNLEKIITPLELSSSRQKSWGTRLGMLAVILIMATTLAAQYLWRYRDNYSVDPRFRSAFEFACTQLDVFTRSECNLPAYSEIEAIRSNNLAVRSHPTREDGLMVTVEIRNMASFPQRFPVLILGFNGANNQVIALREFAPEEYLEPGLQEFEFMPVASPVQISLPIMDPGDDAVNYTLAFRER